MNKKIVINKLIGSIIIHQRKKKTSFILKNFKLSSIKLLDFLWYNKIISGYTKTATKNTIIVFLKHNKYWTIPFKKINTNIRFSRFKQKISWSKNTFFIVKTTIGLLSQYQIKDKQIGGFICYKIF